MHPAAPAPTMTTEAVSVSNIPVSQRLPRDGPLVGARLGAGPGAGTTPEQLFAVHPRAELLEQVVRVDVGTDGVLGKVGTGEVLGGPLRGGEVLCLELQPDTFGIFVVQARRGSVVDGPDGADADLRPDEDPPCLLLFERRSS